MQFRRKCQLIVADQAGSGLDLSQLRIVFNIKKTSAETPNSAEIRVYNLTQDTMAQITKEFTQVLLQAGYEDNYGLIFSGNIKQVKLGREGATDNYLDIAAGDGDDAYNFAIVNTTLAAGSTPSEQVLASLRAMQRLGVGAGYIGETKQATLPRGKVMFGMARDYVRNVAESSNAAWSIQDGKLQILQRTALLPGEAVVLNSRTGLVGVPEETNDGLKVQCLLNPKIRIGGIVQITDGLNQGIYTAIATEHSGDNRGQEWYTTIDALNVDATTNTVKPL